MSSNYDAERLEAIRLQAEIERLVSKINSLNYENAAIEQEIAIAVSNIEILTSNAQVIGQEVDTRLGVLQGHVGQAEITTKELYQALEEITTQYTIFKNISTASRNISQYREEYYTRFSNYHQLRRIALGFVIGVDSNIISSETLRKEVEKSYLQNTDYWLAYAIAAVMLWASDEQEAAKRAQKESLSRAYYNSCLFFLLINLRFNRVEVAKDWYLTYLAQVDMQRLGDEWKWLLQAYLAGAFGSDREFQALVGNSMADQLSQIEATMVDFAGKVADRAESFADNFLHKTRKEYVTLRTCCQEYSQMLELLSQAEKSGPMARYYENILHQEETEPLELPQRIENVLYSLINGYDEAELEVVKNIQFNEAIVSAQGDIAAAQQYFNSQFLKEERRNLGDLLINWAFTEVEQEVDISVKRFSLFHLQANIIAGFKRYAEKYRQKEQEMFHLTIDDYSIVSDEHSFDVSRRKLEEHYDKDKAKNTAKDKQVKIYGTAVLVAVLVLIISGFVFVPAVLAVAVIALVTGSFLLWRRIVDVGKLLVERKRQGVLTLKQCTEEIAAWRTDYHTEDEMHQHLIQVMERFTK